jgi:hypothetical protein
MRVRYLRIAVTVLSLTACVLLTALWVRSYRSIDNLYIRLPKARTLGFSSGLGQLAIEVRNNTWPFGWQFMTQPAAPIRERNKKMAAASAVRGRTGLLRGALARRPTFKLLRLPETSILFMRFWIPVLATGLMGAVLGIPILHRFSLRTLLIAMTLVAVVLGLGLAVLRWPAG